MRNHWLAFQMFDEMIDIDGEMIGVANVQEDNMIEGAHVQGDAVDNLDDDDDDLRDLDNSKIINLDSELMCKIKCEMQYKACVIKSQGVRDLLECEDQLEECKDDCEDEETGDGLKNPDSNYWYGD